MSANDDNDAVDGLCTCEERTVGPDEHNEIVRYAASRKWTGLTHDEEIELAKRIEAHKNAETKQIASDAIDQLVEANHMQVVSSAKRHAGHGVPFAELLEAGEIAVRKAIDHYDYRQGYRFATYARWWIHEELVRRIATRAGGAG